MPDRDDVAGAHEEVGLAEGGPPLLPVGLRDVGGSFEAGDCVELAGPDGSPFARGISAYPAAELRGLVGRKGIDEAVHRDNLVLL